ncbi:glycosyltransferase [Ornithinimicrobium cerasi]|uniref:Glycosyltransferase involved in cell wall bisynthesis n=1 Tax=Ornithinimicrobium cerasi TaxID=2248773 RepID=A0A285VUV2_9MICO|nr:glycosyltransferase [Ornithinimicrobium cerasi]SOC57805.1 Glycosyltransferase involved in cell wall bisynthesis [Ornithinimicrobium cerasi]
MTDLVVISLEVWDEVWRRNQHLVSGLLRTGRVDRVLFVEPAVDVVHDLRYRRRPEPGGLREVTLDGTSGRLWALRPRKVLPRRIDPRGDRRRARGVVTTARRLNLQDPVLWVNDPGGVEVLRASGWPALYDITDDWLLADRRDVELRRARRQEATLLRDCREVVVCSPALARSRSATREVVLIPNAADLAAYESRAPRPADLPAGPVALYVGTAHRDRVDVDLLVRTSEAVRTDRAGSVVLVGPAPLPPTDLAALSRAGVLVLGPRPSIDVPAYLQHADVLMVPHVQTGFTSSLDPIKAYEYRAARRPVVATRVPGFEATSDPLVRTVETSIFAPAVITALRSQVPWTPGLPVDIPTWDERVLEMSYVLDRVAQS